MTELHQKTSEIEPKKPGFYSKMLSSHRWKTGKDKDIHDMGIILDQKERLNKIISNSLFGKAQC